MLIKKLMLTIFAFIAINIHATDQKGSKKRVHFSSATLATPKKKQATELSDAIRVLTTEIKDLKDKPLASDAAALAIDAMAHIDPLINNTLTSIPEQYRQSVQAAIGQAALAAHLLATHYGPIQALSGLRDKKSFAKKPRQRKFFPPEEK